MEPFQYTLLLGGYDGISLFDQLEEEQMLTLVESTVTDGIAMLRYDIRK